MRGKEEMEAEKERRTYVGELPEDLQRMILSYLLPIYSAEGQLIPKTGMVDQMYQGDFFFLIIKITEYIGLLMRGRSDRRVIGEGNNLWQLMIFLFGPPSDEQFGFQCSQNQIIQDLIYLLYEPIPWRLMTLLLKYGFLARYQQIALPDPSRESEALRWLEQTDWYQIPEEYILWAQARSPNVRISMKCAQTHQSIVLYRMAVQSGEPPLKLSQMIRQGLTVLVDGYLIDLPSTTFQHLATLLISGYSEDQMSLVATKLDYTAPLKKGRKRIHLYTWMALVAWAKEPELRRQLLERYVEELNLYSDYHRLMFQLIHEKNLWVETSSRRGYRVRLSYDPDLVMPIFQEMFATPWIIHRGSMYHLLSVTSPKFWPELRPLVQQAIEQNYLSSTRWIRTHLLSSD